MQHLTGDKTDLSKKLLHFRSVARHESEDSLDAVIFGRFRKLSDQLLRDSMMTVRGVNAENFDPCHSAGQAKFIFTGAPQNESNDAIVDFRNP